MAAVALRYTYGLRRRADPRCAGAGARASRVRASNVPLALPHIDRCRVVLRTVASHSQRRGVRSADGTQK